MYYLSSALNKRSWALVFGALSLLTVLLPTFHNYRVWSFLGLVATTYTSWLMVGESLHVGQAKGVKHRGPHDITSFFNGLTTVLFAYGGHSITM
jgi:auxin influx carrier (AUX1 LAX family)